MANESITPLVQEYAVDFATNNNFLFIKGIQGDGAHTRKVRATLTNNGIPYNINEGVQVLIRGKKPDDNDILNTCTIVSDNIVEFYITPEMARVPGKCSYELSVIDAKTFEVLTSFPFIILIYKSSIDAGKIISSDEFGALIDALSRTEYVYNSLEGSLAIVEEKAEIVDGLIAETDALLISASDVIKAAQAATKDAIDKTGDAQRVINAYNSLNVPKAYQDMLDAMAESEELGKELQEQLDRIEEMNLYVLFKNVVDATENARTTTQTLIDYFWSTIHPAFEKLEGIMERAESITTEAESVVEDARNAATLASTAAESALAAGESITEKLGIDDDLENPYLAWSSQHTAEKIEESLHKRIDDLTIYPNSWVENKVYITCEDITENSVIDIYYDNDTLEIINEFEIVYTQGNGYICLEAETKPELNLVIKTILIVNRTSQSVGTVTGTAPSTI